MRKLNARLTPLILAGGKEGSMSTLNIQKACCMFSATVLFGFVVSAQAASFDCTKAETKVEHIICDNPEISKLDDELSKLYKAVIQNRPDSKQTRQAQKQWLKDRDDCADAVCVRQAYAARRISLAYRQTPQGRAMSEESNLEQAKPKVPSSFKEADKKETVKRIMAKVVIKHFASEFCEAFLADLRSMESVEFVEPVERSDKFDDPVWDAYRARCPYLGLFENYDCEPRLAVGLEALPQKEQYERIQSTCRQYRCTENFKHFRLNLSEDEGGREDDVFYCERARGPLNRKGAWQFDSSRGYSIRDTKRCLGTGVASTKDSYSYTYQLPLDNINGIVVYKGKHYIFDLREIDNRERTPERVAYELEVWGYDRRGNEKSTRLYRSCLFTTAALGNK